MPRKTPGPPCSVCNSPSVAKGLCDKHYRRWKQHGDTTATLRPEDWGRRAIHPLHNVWKWTNRGRHGRSDEWSDFWRFVADVGDRPTSAHRLCRIDRKQPWGPSNFHWKQALTGVHYNTTNAEGRRRYQRHWRANNRLRSKANDLRKNYGIDLADFHGMEEAQGGKCAICARAEPLCVDHCHQTGKVRGLLCQNCNRGLGLFKDDHFRLVCAVKYLDRAGQGSA